MTIKRIRQLAICGALFMLAACAGAGDRVDIGVDVPAPIAPTAGGATRVADATTPKTIHLVIHTHNQKWPTWMIATDKLVLDYITGDDSAVNSAEAIEAVQRSCRIYTSTSRPNEIVAVVLNGAVYAAAEFVPAMGGASLFKGAKVLRYGGNASSEEFGGGIGSGIIQMGGKVYPFANCGKGVFERLAAQGNDFNLTIIEPSTY